MIHLKRLGVGLLFTLFGLALLFTLIKLPLLIGGIAIIGLVYCLGGCILGD